VRPLSKLLLLCGVAIAYGACSAGAIAAESPAAPLRIVFVCEHGSVKSLVAMEYFNREVRERGLAYRAIARGTAPEPEVPSVVRDGLHTGGFNVSAFKPQKFAASDLDHASLVVSFDQDVAKIVAGRAHYLKWDDLPDVLTNYARGRDAIIGHLNELIGELARINAP